MLAKIVKKIADFINEKCHEFSLARSPNYRHAIVLFSFILHTKVNSVFFFVFRLISPIARYACHSKKIVKKKWVTRERTQWVRSLVNWRANKCMKHFVHFLVSIFKGYVYKEFRFSNFIKTTKWSNHVLIYYEKLIYCLVTINGNI